MASDRETPTRVAPDAPVMAPDLPPDENLEGRQEIERALDVSLSRGPEQEGGRSWTLVILVVLLILVALLLIYALT
jgi:hypothetical protein